jgi:hypothetical protein
MTSNRHMVVWIGRCVMACNRESDGVKTALVDLV